MKYKYTCGECGCEIEDTKRGQIKSKFDQRGYNYAYDLYKKHLHYEEFKAHIRSDYERKWDFILGWYRNNFDLDHYVWRFHHEEWDRGWYNASKPNKDDYKSTVMYCPECFNSLREES